MNLIAKMPLLHKDDRDTSVVMYRKDNNGYSEYIVWREKSDGERYWGDYFTFNADSIIDEERAYREACTRFLYLCAWYHNVELKARAA